MKFPQDRLHAIGILPHQRVAEKLHADGAFGTSEIGAAGEFLQVQRFQLSRGQTPQTLVLLDSRGMQFSSEDLAKFLNDYQDRNPLPLVFAIGPANGFSEEARKSATSLLSLGNMTLAHELARVVLLEQVYRAFTIIQGHPYHLGH